MADYSSLKVPELKKLLAEKKLAQTGNKADLIARLQEEDQKTDAPGSETKPGETKEDEISYSDDEAVGASTTAPATEAGASSAPIGDDATITTKASNESAEKPAETEEAAPKEPAPSFALGLSSTAADDEAKRRADRAKRFGIEEDDESVKRAERAKKFGINEKDLATSLDSALPERSLKRGRGRGGDGADGNRPGKRQSLDRRGGDRRNRDRRQGRGGGGDAPTQKAGNHVDDPAKLEKRAARFAAA